MSKRTQRFVLLLLLISSCCVTLPADDTTTTSSATSVTPEPYTKDEFPQWAHNLRRTEIITFGSLPFVTLGTTIVYSFYRYIDNDFSSSYVPNPFAKTSEAANLSTSEQMGILGTSAAICVGLGITDLIYMLAKQNKEKKAAAQRYLSDMITIEPMDAPLDRPEPPPEDKRQSDFMYGDIKSALF